MSQGKGYSGECFDIYLSYAMAKEHPEWSETKKLEIRSSIVANLVYQDAYLRLRAFNSQEKGYLTTNTIAHYH